MSDRIRRIEAHFEHCVDLPKADQDAFLASLQDESDVIEEVRKLLQYAVEVDGTMSTDQAEALEGTSIDRYRILSTIGEGGFGVVYLAQQERPISRKVALKVIKPGMDSRAVIARFETERQTLAMMDHPGVARMFDGGMTPEQRPYFVMEFVQGEPITTFCDRHRLSIGDRISLFQQACDAVQHAHTKGVIHRDLKPSNILVAYEDGTPTVKVIDFGISKALNQTLTAQTVFTSTGQLVGTPEYMSPEQAEMTSLNVDTRTDVYSLGVILYELLAGVLPFSADELRSAGIAGIQQIIRDKQPSKPSTKCHSNVTDAPDSASAVAYSRTIDPASLPRRLKGDLDWIIMKCLEKERSRRYESPSAIGSDLSRHLDNQPVLAGPPSFRYRARKFIRRHKRTVIGSSIAGIIVIGSALALAVLGVVAYNINYVQSAQSEFMETVLDDMVAQAQELGDNAALFAVLKIAEQRSDAFEGYPRAWVEHLNTLIVTYQKVGDVEHSLPLIKQTMHMAVNSLGPNDKAVFHARLLSAKCLAIQGRHDDAARAYAKTLKEASIALGEGHEMTTAISSWYINLLIKMDREEEVQTLAQQFFPHMVKNWGEKNPNAVASTAAYVAHIYDGQEKHDQAVQWNGQALQFRTAAIEKGMDGDISTLLLAQAQSLYPLDRFAETVKCLQQRIDLLGEQHVFPNDDNARMHNLLGLSLHAIGRTEESLGHLRTAYSIASDLFESTHQYVAIYRSNLMQSLTEQERWKEIEPLLHQELDYCRHQYGAEADDTFNALHNLYRVYGHLGQSEDARRYRNMIPDEHLRVLDQHP